MPRKDNPKENPEVHSGLFHYASSCNPPREPFILFPRATIIKHNEKECHLLIQVESETHRFDVSQTVPLKLKLSLSSFPPKVTSCVRREEQSLSPGLFENQCKQMSSLMPGTSQALSYGCGSSSLSNNVYGWRRVWGLELLLPLLPHLQKEWTHPSLQRKILSVSHLLPWGEVKNNQRWNKQIQLLSLSPSNFLEKAT